MNLQTIPQSAARHPAPLRTPGFRFCRYDAAAILLVFLLAAGTALGLYQAAGRGLTRDSGLEAVLTVNGQEVWRADISDTAAVQTWQLTGIDGHMTVRAEPGRACISYSDCPDQVCVKTGWLTSAGQSAVCLPHKAVLTILASDGAAGNASETSSAYDVISR